MEDEIPQNEATEIKFFALLQADGKPAAFYNTDIYDLEQIPDEAVEINQETWQEYLSNQSGYRFSSDGELIVVPPPTPEELEEIEKNRPPTEMELIGRQLVARELEALELKSENELLGQQVVDRELESLAIKADNELLGQQLVNIEIRLMEGGL